MQGFPERLDIGPRIVLWIVLWILQKAENSGNYSQITVTSPILRSKLKPEPGTLKK